MVWLWAVLSPRDGLKSSGAGTSLFVSALLWAGLETKHYLAPDSLQERPFSSVCNHRITDWLRLEGLKTIFFHPLAMGKLSVVLLTYKSLLLIMNVGEIISEHKTSKGGSWPGVHTLEQCTRVLQQGVCCTQ